MKRHIITLSGMPGSGKSSTADALAAALGYQRFSSGDFMRTVARDRGLSLEALGSFAERDRSVDDAIDAEIKKAAAAENLVIDSRLAYHWIPESFKVFLQLDLHLAAKRIYDHIRAVGRVGQSADTLEGIYSKMIERIENEKKRYQEYYGIDYTNPSNFDLVVDTGIHSLADVTQIILGAYQQWESD